MDYRSSLDCNGVQPFGCFVMSRWIIVLSNCWIVIITYGGCVEHHIEEQKQTPLAQRWRYVDQRQRWKCHKISAKGEFWHRGDV